MRTLSRKSRRDAVLNSRLLPATATTALVAVVALLVASSAASAPQTDLLPNSPPALGVFRNSHATAMAWLVKYDGLNKHNEADKNLIALCWMYAQYCECDKPGRPIIWRMAEGLKRVYAGRGRELVVKDQCRDSPQPTDRTSFAGVRSRIVAGRPVIVTFCYDAGAERSLAAAKRREQRCLTAVAIGTVENDQGQYLICRDGMASGGDTPASSDRVKPEHIGLSATSGAWTEAGTSIYKWAGGQKNIVVVYTSTAKRK